MPPTSFSHARVTSPRQTRSEASLERILETTRRLLEEHTFDELSVTRIVREARSSVGAFYARFADKQALLDGLDELYTRDVIAELQTLGEKWREQEVPVGAMIDEASRFLVDFHRQRRGVVRALVLHARLHPDGPFADRTRRMQAETPAPIVAFLARQSAIGHPDPERAVRFAFVQALTTVREHVLFPEGPAAVTRLDDEGLVLEVARSWRRYLDVDRPSEVPREEA